MADPQELRGRILEATVAELGRRGFGGLSMEAVAGRAGVSRATLYRRVASSRDELVSSAVTWEVGRFLDRLRALDDPTATPVDRLEALLVGAIEGVDTHPVIQSLLVEDPNGLAGELGGVAGLVLAVITAEFEAELARLEIIPPAGTPAEAAEYLARMVLSYVGSPGRIDLRDRTQLKSLVATELLGWI